MSRIAAIRAAAAGVRASGDADEDTEDHDDDGAPPAKSRKKDNPDMTDTNTDAAAIEQAKAEAASAAHSRLMAVIDSEHYAGREALAKAMLANASLSAEEITGLLAAAPKPGASAIDEERQREAAEEGGRKEMKAVLEQTRNSDIDAGSGEPKAADVDAIWERGIARAWNLPAK